jgi:DNA-binding NarL/FixJ family response regulator
MPIVVSLVEDDAGIRDSLARLLKQSREFRFLQCYPTGEAALQDVPHSPPDVLLMDIKLPGMNGIECVQKLRALVPELRIVMLTVYENPERIFNALAAGAVGYILKQRPSAEVLTAIRDAHEGGAPMSSQIARKVVQFFEKSPATTASDASLSTRELEVLKLLAKGYLIKEIGDQLGISFVTTRTYIRRIYEKLHVHSRAQAVAKYLPAVSPPGQS